jgi:hypothetical protein
MQKHPKKFSDSKPSDERARQSRTRRGLAGRPISHDTNLPYVDIVICIGPYPILETWPPIYRGQEGMV